MTRILKFGLKDLRGVWLDPLQQADECSTGARRTGNMRDEPKGLLIA